MVGFFPQEDSGSEKWMVPFGDSRLCSPTLEGSTFVPSGTPIGREKKHTKTQQA